MAKTSINFDVTGYGMKDVAKTYTDPATGQTVIVGPDGNPIDLTRAGALQFMPYADKNKGAMFNPLNLNLSLSRILPQFLIENRIPFRSPFKGVDVFGENYVTSPSHADKVFIAASINNTSNFSTLTPHQVRQNGNDRITLAAATGNGSNQIPTVEHLAYFSDIQSEGFDASGRTFIYLQTWALLSDTVAYTSNAGDMTQAQTDFNWGYTITGEGTISNPDVPGTRSPTGGSNRIVPFVVKPRFTCPSIDVAHFGASVSQGTTSNTFINAVFMATWMESNQSFAWGYGNYCVSSSSFGSSIAKANLFLDDPLIRPKVIFIRNFSSNDGFSEANFTTARNALIALQAKCLELGVILCVETHTPWNLAETENGRLKAHNQWTRDAFKLSPNVYICDYWAVIKDPSNDAVGLPAYIVGGAGQDQHWSRTGYNMVRDQVVIPVLRAIKAGVPFVSIPGLPTP